MRFLWGAALPCYSTPFRDYAAKRTLPAGHSGRIPFLSPAPLSRSRTQQETGGEPATSTRGQGVL